VSILGAVLVGLLLSWLVSLGAHVNFRRGLSAEQLQELPMRSPFGMWGSIAGFALVLVALLESGFTSHLTLISGAVYMIVLTVAYWAIKPIRRRQVQENACEGVRK